VQSLLKARGLDSTLVMIESQGDQNRTQPLYEIQSAGPGLFTKQLEDALLRKEVDLAVHSLKDLPTLQPPELMVAAIPVREVTHDVLLTLKGKDSTQGPLFLRAGLKVGTSSLRRQALIKSYRPDLTVAPLRGNVPTRVNAVLEEKVDAVVLAAAGLKRLGLDLSQLVVTPLSVTEFVPAPGQGALGLEVRKDADPRLLAVLALIHDEMAARETQVERRILRELEGGCTLPLGVSCRRPSGGNAESEWRVISFLGVDSVTDGKRSWLGFERFDISGAEPDTLAVRSVDHLKAFLQRCQA